MEVRPYERLRYHVASESTPDHWYLVDILTHQCSCRGYETSPIGEKHCKHLDAALIYFARREILPAIRAKTKR